MRRRKLYRFSLESLTFHEANWARTRLVLSGILLGGAIFWSLIAINERYGDIFGMGFIQQQCTGE